LAEHNLRRFPLDCSTPHIAAAPQTRNRKATMQQTPARVPRTKSRVFSSHLTPPREITINALSRSAFELSVVSTVNGRTARREKSEHTGLRP
jgi:hypothetical protein